jgi:uncharacterized membrane protein
MTGADRGRQLAQAEIGDAMRGYVGDRGTEQPLARIGLRGALAWPVYHAVQLVYHVVRFAGVVLMSYAASIDIDTPAERVWSVMTDVERWPEWTASITSVQRLDHGPFGVGSRALIKQPKLAAIVWTVTDWQPNRSFTWTAGAVGVTTVAGHQITSRPEGGVTVTLSIQETGWLGPLVGRVLFGLTRRYIDMEVAGLKRRAEAVSFATAA